MKTESLLELELDSPTHALSRFSVASAEFDTYTGPSRTTYDEHTIHERLLIEATRRRELSPVSRLPSETGAYILFARDSTNSALL